MLAVLLAGSLPAQDTRQQDAKQQEQLRAEIAALRADLEGSQDLLDSLLARLQTSQPGSTRFLLTGYGIAGYSATRNEASAFSTSFVPIMLWQLSDRVLFTAEPEFEMGEELDFEIEYAHLAVQATDFLTLGAGKFLTPFTLFTPRLHAAWINKLPDAPLAFAHGGVAPGSGVGAYARGGLPLGMARANYSVYVINAPMLMTTGPDAGELESADASETRAYGGRVGLFLLGRGIEFGYSIQSSDVAVLHGLDLTLSKRFDPLRGTLDLRVEGVRSDADTGPFLAEDGGPDRFLVDNRRQGWYTQLAYRPTMADSPLLRNVELVGRYERLDRPDWVGGELGNDTRRATAGVDLWLTPSALVKVAFQRTVNTMGGNTRTLLFQTAIGF